MQLLDGKALSKKIITDLKSMIYDLRSKICLGIILVGDDPDSHKYIDLKARQATKIGIYVQTFLLKATSSDQEIIDQINRLNTDPDIHAIIVQLPLPLKSDKTLILNSIDPQKDVDGLTAHNLGLLFQSRPEAIPSATALGIIKLLEEYSIDLDGKNAVIISRSLLVGLPLLALLTAKNSTVTLCHSHTKNLKEICSRADILVSATGKTDLITANFVKDGAIVVDAAKDVDFTNVSPKCSYITPVPGGVGPMTVAMLLVNTVRIWKNKL